ncbi:DUF3352 domain-containing protein [Egbenema bharatensis]|uniref:DUF3352 domain-containing protein n=1 Tax=Egbenema bharatensis TaxID=3463334 RepID=UPI003A8B0D99
MKTRSFVSILISVVLVLLLAGGAGAYWLVSRNPLLLMEGVEQAPEASVFLSRQSPLVVSLLVHPDRLTAFGLAVTPPTQRKRVQTQWQHFRQAVFGNRELDYQQDIQPWLGNELTFAVTTPDIDRDALNGEQPGYLLAAAIRNGDKANQAIQTYWQRQATTGVDLVFEQFAGVNLVYSDREQATPTVGTASETALATAVVGDRFVLFANHPKVLRDAINNLQVPELSLSRSESYQQALQQLVQPHVGLAFVHLPQLAAWLEDTDANSSPLPPTAATATFDSVLMALRLDDQGIIADTQLLTAPGQTIEPSRPEFTQPVSALQYIPANSPLVAAGHNLEQDWATVTANLDGYEALQKLLHQPLDSLAQQWETKPEEIMSWIQDEYALGLLPQENGTQSDWIFVTQQSPELSDRLTQLDQTVQQEGISIGRFTIAEQPVTAWTKLSAMSRTVATAESKLDRKANRKSDRSNPRESVTVQAEVQGVHASIAGYEIFATSLDAIAQCLESSQNSLVATDRFQQEIAALPSPNDGYIFVDWLALQETDRSTSSPLPKLKGRLAFLRPVINELRTLTFSSNGSSSTAAKGTLFLRL